MSYLWNSTVALQTRVRKYFTLTFREEKETLSTENDKQEAPEGSSVGEDSIDSAPTQPDKDLPGRIAATAHIWVDPSPVNSTADFDTWLGYYTPVELSKTVRVALRECLIYVTLRMKEGHHDMDAEVRRWTSLSHPNILPFLGTARVPIGKTIRVCFVVPWMENGNALAYVKSHEEVDKLAIIQGIGGGLEYLHSLEPPLVHGYLRSSNVLMDKEGRPQLCDFGIAQFRGILDGLTERSSERAYWMSPECLAPTDFGFRDLKEAETTAADVYSFGMTAYEIYTERRPFADQRGLHVVLSIIRGARPSIPSTWMDDPATRQLEGTISDCWEQDPAKRPTITEALRSLIALPPWSSDTQL
ncbi:kinase-like protein [Calocera cornea HHB12733]|uniref:Kinase-like protein n=1 Tax=Calocera cornea HHB12733 TaxID=1353952 RepID=A0A165E1L2_9BASI|nr:kinase-like protein [Calocera cornea HHB12733]